MSHLIWFQCSALFSKFPNYLPQKVEKLISFQFFCDVFFNTFFHYDVVSIIDFSHIYKLAEKKQKNEEN